MIRAAGGSAAATSGPTLDPKAQALGFIGYAFNPEFANATTTNTSGQIQVQSIWLPAGTKVTGVSCLINIAAAGTKPTGVWSGLADSTTTMLAQSGDLSAGSGVPFAAAGYASLPLSAPYTTAAAGLYYMLSLMVGTYGTTQPTFLYFNNAASPAGSRAFGSNPINCGYVAGQTGLPANGSTLPAVTASATQNWLALY